MTKYHTKYNKKAVLFVLKIAFFEFKVTFSVLLKPVAVTKKHEYNKKLND